MAIDRETQVLSAAYAGGIRSPRELANFMAQVSHESNGLNRLEESFRYMRGVTQIPGQAAWREGPQVLEAARKEALQGKPQRLAELMYGDRNGNNEPGDGFRYHGRGYLPVPGKGHYRAAGAALGINLVDTPELAAEPQHAARIAVWYWRNHVPPEAREDVKAATQALNGRLYGLDDRRMRFDTWEKRLTPHVMARLAHPEQDNDVHPADARIAEASSAALAANALRARAKKRSKEDEAKKTTLDTDSQDDGVDPILRYEQQRRVMDEASDFLPPAPPSRPHHHPHTHPYVCALPLDAPAHPQHALYKQAQEAVRQLDHHHMRQPDERSDNLAAALTVEAHRKGMTRIDHVALSEDASRTFAVQGDIHSPHKLVADVTTDTAVKTSTEQSTQALATHVATETPDPTHVQQAIKPPHGH